MQEVVTPENEQGQLYMDFQNDSEMQAFERGFARGWKRGWKQGWKQGRREEKISLARKMLASGDESIEKIVRYTGLTNEEVNALAGGKEI